MMEILNGTQISYRVDITMNIESEVCDLHCDSQLNQRFDSCIQQPEFNIVDTFHSPASEDFALIADKVPSAWFAIGAAVDLPEHCYSLHHPKTAFHEDALLDGAFIYARCALDYMDTNLR